MMAHEQWQQALGDAGFADVERLVETGTTQPIQSVFVAQAARRLNSQDPVVQKDRWVLWHDENVELQALVQTWRPGDLYPAQTEVSEVIAGCAEAAGLLVCVTEPMSDLTQGVLRIATLAQALNRAQNEGLIVPSQVVVLTSGAVPLSEGEPSVGLPGAGVWGMVRSLMNEQPQIHWRVCDVDAEVLASPDTVLAELAMGEGEREVRLRPGQRWVPRLDPMLSQHALVRPLQEQESAHLIAGQPGLLETLHFTRTATKPLAAREVRVRVHTAGANFKDVMLGMGMLSADVVEEGYLADNMGLEMSGTIVELGHEVTEFEIGDEVYGFARNSFAPWATARVEALCKRRSNVSFEAAATLPATYFTAHYGLVDLARIRSDDVVLIHGGAGGVGIAAIHICN